MNLSLTAQPNRTFSRRLPSEGIQRAEKKNAIGKVSLWRSLVKVKNLVAHRRIELLFQE